MTPQSPGEMSRSRGGHIWELLPADWCVQYDRLYNPGALRKCDEAPEWPPCPTCPGHTLSLSCWQSCRETVKYTRASLSQGTTHSTLWTWLTSRRCEPHSLGRDEKWSPAGRPGPGPQDPVPSMQRGGGKALGPLTVYSQHGPGAVEHGTSGGAEVLGRSTRVPEVPMGSPQQGWSRGSGGRGELYLGGGGLQGVQLVHGEAQLVEVDVDVDQQVRG